MSPAVALGVAVMRWEWLCGMTILEQLLFGCVSTAPFSTELATTLDYIKRVGYGAGDVLGIDLRQLPLILERSNFVVWW